MAQQPPEAKGSTGGEADWESFYSRERVQRWLRGEMTLQELNGITGAEMVDIARLGYQLYENGRYADAKTVFSGLSALDPGESYYLTALGAIHLAENDLDSGLKCFDRAIVVNPDDLAAHANRGELHLSQGRLTEALNDFQEALRLDPECKDPLMARVRLLVAATVQALEQLQKGPQASANQDQGKAGPSKSAPEKKASPGKKK